MRDVVLMAGFLAIGGLAAGAVKGATGIYLTAHDYTNRRLTAESDCNAPGHKVALHDIAHKPYIDVTHGGETHRYKKADVYGFRSCDGREYRFVDNREYQIVESLEIVIYTIQVPARESKDLARDRPTVPLYFFSVGPASECLPLTRNNLKRAFPDNHAFHDALDVTFQSDEQLSQYDEFHKMFKVNRLLIASAR